MTRSRSVSWSWSSLRELGRYDALLLTALIWFLAKFLRYAFPPLFGPFQETYGVSNTVLGAAFTGFMLVYAAMQFPSGVLADRLGSVTVITAGVVLASSAALVLVVDSPFVVLVLAMLVMGAGTGAHKTVAVRLLARAYPARTGRALGFLDTFGAFGGVAAPAAVVFVAGVTLFVGTGWRLLFFVAGVVGLLLGIAFLTRVPKRLPGEAVGGPVSRPAPDQASTSPRDGGDTDTNGGSSPDEANDDPDSSTVHPDSNTADPDSSTAGTSPSPGLRQYATLFRDHRFTVFVLATICFSFTYNGLVAFAPLYLTDEAGLEPSTANVLYSALFAVSLVQLVTGEVSDRVGTLPVIVVALGLASVAMIAFVALTGLGSALVLGATLVAVGLGSHGFRPVRGAYLMAAVPDSIAGGSLGVVRTLLMGAGAVAPAIVGFLSEAASFRVAFWLLAATVCVATVLCAYLLATDATAFRASRVAT